MRRIRTIAVLPTLFTVGNLVCGFFAIVVASRIPAPESAQIPVAAAIEYRAAPVRVPDLNREDPTHNLMFAGWLIFLAMVFDALDGQVARLSRTNTDFGAQLDSLCDVVTFGVAPAILLVKMCPTFSYLHPKAIWIIAAFFAACAAMRLARYNVESGDHDDHLNFCGLPTPAAAAVIAGFAILTYTLRLEDNTFALYDRWMQYTLPIFSVPVALLMVSRIPYPHLVNQMLHGQRSFDHVVKLLVALVAIMLVRGYAVPILCVVFVLGPPLRYFWLQARGYAPKRAGRW
ncbi:MAG: CDP-diacylglycerol--serine O-phosphatidyltransferase [Pirellulales bacterium]